MGTATPACDGLRESLRPVLLSDGPGGLGGFPRPIFEEPEDIPGVWVHDVEGCAIRFDVVVVLAQASKICGGCWATVGEIDAMVRLALMGRMVAARVAAGAVAALNILSDIRRSDVVLAFGVWVDLVDLRRGNGSTGPTVALDEGWRAGDVSCLVGVQDNLWLGLAEDEARHGLGEWNLLGLGEGAYRLVDARDGFWICFQRYGEWVGAVSTTAARILQGNRVIFGANELIEFALDICLRGRDLVRTLWREVLGDACVDAGKGAGKRLPQACLRTR